MRLGLIALLVIGCAQSSAADAGVDAPMPCSDEGAWACTGAQATACCGGVWVSFVDGPCDLPRSCSSRFDASLDASSLDAGTGEPCASAPHTAGCPCAVGTSACGGCLRVLTCPAGTYVEGTETCGGCLFL